MIRDYPYTLAAGKSVSPPVKARYIGLKSSTIDSAAILVTAMNKDGDVLAEVKLLPGEKIPGLNQESATVIIENTSGSQVDIVMVMGNSPFESDRLSGEVSIAVPGAITALDDQTIGALGNYTVPANSARKELHIVSDTELRYGDGASATKGVKIAAGVTANIACSGTLYLFNPSGGSAKVNLSEVV